MEHEGAGEYCRGSFFCLADGWLLPMGKLESNTSDPM